MPHTGNSTERLRQENCHEFVAGMGYTKFQGNLGHLVRPCEFCNSLQATDTLCITLLFVWRSSQTSKQDGFSLKTLTLWRTAAPLSQTAECHHTDLTVFKLCSGLIGIPLDYGNSLCSGDRWHHEQAPPNQDPAEQELQLTQNKMTTNWGCVV